MRCRRLDESKVGTRKASEVRKDFCEVAAIDTEPGRERGEELVASGCGNPATGTRIIRAADGQDRESSISLLSVHSAAHNKVMVPPAVVAALTVGREGPAKIAA